MLTVQEIPVPRSAGSNPANTANTAERLRVLIVAGIPIGVLVAGVGSRLAMLLLRVTSPDQVNGVTSDDGFTIGQFTLAGTYNLLMVGAVVGIIGAAAYRAVAPWLVGPRWLHRVTTAAASGAVVGSLLVHADGVDFTLLQPTWLAIGLFVALPALFGALIGLAVDRVADPGSWTARGRWRWALPVLLVACFPMTLIVVVLAAVMLAIGTRIRRAVPVAAHRTKAVDIAVRAVCLAIAVTGLVTLVQDITALT